MQPSRIKFGIVVILIISAVLFSNKNNVWASPDQSPNRQTVPTRNRTKSPTPEASSTPTQNQLVPTNTSTAKPNQVTPVNTDALNNPTVSQPTATPDKITAQTPTLTPILIPVETAAGLVPTFTSTALMVGQSTTTNKVPFSTVSAATPTAAAAQPSSARIGKSALVIVIVGISMIIIGVLVFAILKKRST